ncbi:MAG: acyl-CoA dehydrogenase family protein [Dehalococcoidia bacterium]|nr:acyl-CoA dehydrogenase family protein [Dehalococcoidia bacterium]
MDFALTAEQEMLRKEVRHFLETECPKPVVRKLEASEVGYSEEMWRKMAQLGWLGLVLPEAYGGLGGSLLDLAVLLEEMGRATAPSPIFSTIVMGVLPILEAGTDEQKKRLLTGVANGEILLTMAIAEPGTDYQPQHISTHATHHKDGSFTVSGIKLFVHNAHTAGYLLVVAQTRAQSAGGDGISILVVDRKSPGISLTPLITIAADRQYEVALDKVPCGAGDILGGLNKGWPVVESTLRKAAALQCVEMVGVAQKALELTASYAATRIQFARPIGSFQAVQHRMADMLTDVESARWLSYQAVWRLDRGLPAVREVSIAKAWTSDACQRVVSGAHHIHGGIGFDLDYDLHYHFRWSKAMELNLGSAPIHKTLGESAIIEDLLTA